MPLQIHYMLTEDLGDRWVAVEAFENPFFQGNPVKTEIVPGFDAKQAGMKTSLAFHLQPGKYYFRAWLSEDMSRNPYDYSGIQLIRENPIGVYGAISSAKPLTVKKEMCPQLKHIYIDQLFKNPDAGPGTEARLRILFTTDDEYYIPHHRNLVVALHKQPDFAMVPEETWNISTENLLVVDRIGKTEFISPELETGSVYLSAWIDSNQNGYLDENEAQGTIENILGEPKAIIIKEQRTETVKIHLKIQPPPPSS